MGRRHVFPVISHIYTPWGIFGQMDEMVLDGDPSGGAIIQYVVVNEFVQKLVFEAVSVRAS